MSHLTREIDGFEILGLQSERAELWLAPGLGGKWVSLRDRTREREWMWSPPAGRGLFRAPDANAFHTSCLVGADECIPTIATSHWQGRDLPDHGEVWNVPWEVLPAGANGTTADTLSIQVDMAISPLRLTRRVMLQDVAGEAVINVDYTLENRGDAPEPFVWAFHPLLWIVPGDQLALAPGVDELRVESTVGIDLGGRGATCAWPNPAPGVDLSSVDLGTDDRATKFFTHPLSDGQGWARVHNPAAQTSLTFAFDTESVMTLGIWLTRGGWNGYHHLAVEPGIGAPDPLDVAVNDWQQFGSVAPRSHKSWQFTLTVGD